MKELSPTEDSNVARSAMRLVTSLLDDFQPAGEGAGGSSGGAPQAAGGAAMDAGEGQAAASQSPHQQVSASGFTCSASPACSKSYVLV